MFISIIPWMKGISRADYWFCVVNISLLWILKFEHKIAKYKLLRTGINIRLPVLVWGIRRKDSLWCYWSLTLQRPLEESRLLKRATFQGKCSRASYRTLWRNTRLLYIQTSRNLLLDMWLSQIYLLEGIRKEFQWSIIIPLDVIYTQIR